MRGSSVWPREGLALGHAVLYPTFLYLSILLLAPGHLPFFQKPSMFDVSRELGSSVALYSRKVLIQTKATDILPKWLRFVRGTVAATQAGLRSSVPLPFLPLLPPMAHIRGDQFRM